MLAGQDLTKELEGTLGATLENQPGVAERSFGPGPSRPVIRGLDGDRVLILEDGQRVGDLSSQSGDHGVPLNPASATRIEVVRGPATLLHGSNAIGGLVNVISDTIPTRAIQGSHGGVVVDFGVRGEGVRDGGRPDGGKRRMGPARRRQRASERRCGYARRRDCQHAVARWIRKRWPVVDA